MNAKMESLFTLKRKQQVIQIRSAQCTVSESAENIRSILPVEGHIVRLFDENHSLK